MMTLAMNDHLWLSSLPEWRQNYLCMQSLGEKKRKWEGEQGGEGGWETREGEGRAEKDLRPLLHWIGGCIVVPLIYSLVSSLAAITCVQYLLFSS